MRIRWISHPNPKLQHLNGKIVHETRESVAPYILSGQCEEVPYKNYIERLNDIEAARIAALPKSANASGWGIRETRRSEGNPVRFVVTETSPLGEVTFYDAPPEHAPSLVKQQFADAIATDAAAVGARAEFLKKQREHVEPTNMYPAGDIAAVIFGANGVKRG